MSFAVDCPCGKTYSKPERKAGSTFRCLACGRELTVPLTRPLDDLPLAVPPVDTLAAPRRAPTPVVPAEPEEDTPPRRRGLLRTFGVWLLLGAGLIGVVGGGGQLGIFWIVDQMNRDNARLEAQMVGNVVMPPRPAKDVQLGYATGIGSIVVGVLLTAAGFVLREVTGPPVLSKRRPQRRQRRAADPVQSVTAPLETHADACPECGAAMTAEAVLCIACGFNRKTGQRVQAAAANPVRHFLPEGGWLVRLLVTALLFTLGAFALIVLLTDPWMRAGAVAAWALLLLLIGGSRRRLTILRDAGRPVLITRQYVAFLPLRPTRSDLRRYGTIRLGYSRELRGDQLLLGFLALGIFVVFMKRDTYTVEITGVFDQGQAPDVEPVMVYRGPSERLSRALADALRDIGGLRIG